MMNFELRIKELKEQIESNLATMSNRNLSNELFCNLSDENRIMMNELTSIYRQMHEEVDNKIDEFLSKRRMKMKADEVLEIIKNMEVSEKWKLLNELYHLHYDKRSSPRANIKY